MCFKEYFYKSVVPNHVTYKISGLGREQKMIYVTWRPGVVLEPEKMSISKE